MRPFNFSINVSRNCNFSIKGYFETEQDPETGTPNRSKDPVNRNLHAETGNRTPARQLRQNGRVYPKTARGVKPNH